MVNHYQFLILSQGLGLHKGSRFKDTDPESARRITELTASICRHEAFWVERLSTLQPVGLPYPVRNVSPPQSARYASVPVPIPNEVTSYLVDCQTDWNLSDFLLAAFAVYLARIGDVCSFDIRYRGLNCDAIWRDWKGFSHRSCLCV